MRKTSRRGFARTIASAAAALPLFSRPASPQTPPPPQSGRPAAEATPVPREEIKPLAEAMTGIIRAQYGKHLPETDLREIQKDFNDSLSGLERMRSIPLANADEPDFTFTIEARR